jgi:ACS family hexuronate transporter-like MFS transporter
MDRQTLANASVRITKEFQLTQAQYGNIEAVFAYAFAAGSIVFGWLADRFSVRWLYAGRADDVVARRTGDRLRA